LTKDPSAYADAKSQPHVAVALRMRKKGLTATSGDTIPYVICHPPQSQQQQQGSSSGLADCAYHPDEVRKDPSLKIDQLWYLQTQLHPPIARLCEHLEGTDSARLASCLGLDPKKFKAYSSNSATNGESDGLIGGIKFSTLLSDEERFANVEKLQLCCPSCRDTFQFTGVAKELQDENDPAGAQGSAVKVAMECVSCKSRIPVPALYYSVQESLRQASNRYHSYWMRCDEVECGLETERMGVYDRRCPHEGCKGTLRSVLPASYLYTHLLYLRSLFAPDKVISKLSSKLSMSETKMLQQLGQEIEPVRAFIEEQLRQCAYPVIDFKTIFSYLLK
jgi:DNA polymerase alpha subunit A